jgi:hypothetical protein
MQLRQSLVLFLQIRLLKGHNLYSLLDDIPTSDGKGNRRMSWNMATAIARIALCVSLLPRCVVDLGRDRDSDLLRQRYEKRRWGFRTNTKAQAILRLPDQFDAYLSGRSKRAVRTNLNRLRLLGYTTSEVPRLAGRELIGRVYAARGVSHDETDEYAWVNGTGGRWFATLNSEGQPMAVALIEQGGRLAKIRFLITVRDGEESANARYVIHTHIVQTLIQDGAELLTVGGVLKETKGSRYLERRLGYEAVNLTVF